MHETPQHPRRRSRLRRAGAGLLGAATLVAGITAATPAPVAQAAGGTAERTSAGATTERTVAHRRQTARRVQSALHTARRQKGDPYRYGAAGPNAFDCSGLVKFSFGKAGFRMPRTSSAQAGAVKRIPRHRMRPGDLVFFTGSGGVYHVGIFAKWDDGRRVIIHSPGSGQRVHAAKIWTGSWFAGTVRHR